MRTIALVALFFLVLGTGCASKRTRTYYTGSTSYRSPSTSRLERSYVPARAYRSTYATRSVRSRTYSAPRYAASRVPPRPPPPPLYGSNVRRPARTVVYSARPATPRTTVTRVGRPARSSYATPRAASAIQPPRLRKSGLSFVGGLCNVVPNCSGGT